ncbi:MAG: PGF-pre-PGF domain-containing protein, partial [Candidatus Methanoperedens sp.]|nr:PGF-pre-PGF domain-containing protein [Candidatus Methanoperedens sp.]
YRVESGAFNEGLADYFASSINGNPCIAEGLDGDCIRYLNNTYRFPEDVAGETHKDGRIVSGSSWDLREMLGSDISDSLVINALKLEPFNFSEYLDDIIVADDNNANLEDGTPHLFEICTAFFKNHGIFSSYCNMYYRSPLTVNLLKNPGFESESANWTEYSNEGHLIIKKNPMGTYSGNWLAYMGDYNDMDQYIFQDITIPSRIEKAYVQFWYWIRSKETTEGSANDIMRIEVRRPDDDTLLKSLGTLSNLNKSYGYSISEQYDLSEFKNETIRLKLTTTTDPFEPTAFLVDDIGLMVVYDTIPPDIDYVPPTPANNSNLSQNSIIVNITASEIVNASILEWDGINETMAGSGINWYTEKTGLNDGKYVYKVRCNDSSDNWNENEARVVTVDTRPPIITANPTGYPANQMVSKNGDTIFFNVTIIDPVSNIRNASVSVSQINKSLDRIVLDPNNGFWTNSSVIMNVSDGQYYLNISAYDYAGNVNNTEYLAVIVDTTPPIVHSSQALYQRRDTANNLSIIEINVSANDPFVNGISAGLRNASVNASIINTTGIIELVNLSGFWKGIVIFDKYIAEGNYSMNVTVYDNAGNINDSMKVFLSKDSTPPSPTEVSLIGLPQESQISDSAGAIRTFSITANQTVNVTWYINGTEVKSGEKGVTSAYTNTSAAQGTWIVNATATNANDTVSKEWKWIVNPPLIITITSPDNNSENINGDIIVTVNLNRDGTALLNWNGANESMIKAGTSFYKNKTGLPSGNYSFQIYANDSNGVINASETRIVTVNKTLIDNTIGNFINTSNFIVNSTLEIASPSRNTTLVISNGTNASIAGAPLTWISIESTTKINSTFTASLASNDKFVGENVTLGPSGAVFNPSIRIRFNYTDAQLTAAQITASQLRVKFYDITTNTWVEQTPYNLNETGKYITANASHFSTFVLLGTKSPTTSNPPPGSGSGGGGGGGGGGASGENYTNIEVIEKYDLWISKDALTSYRFNHAKNPIMFVNITGNASYGIITTSVEVLKNISSLVKTRPEGLVYRNVNIWVGTSGFATLKNIKEASIMFRVDTSWISLNNLSSSDIKLLKWDGSQWMTLDTKVNEKDGTNTYFEGRTDNFSEFAITGIKAQGGPSAGGPSNEAEIKPTGTHVAATNTPTATTNPKQKAPGFQIVTVIAALSTFYIFQRKRSSERKLKVRNLKS